jgi:hypothetical protein
MREASKTEQFEGKVARVTGIAMPVDGGRTASM